MVPDLLLGVVWAAAFLLPTLKNALQLRARGYERTNYWTGTAYATGLTQVEARGEALEAQAGALRFRISPVHGEELEHTRVEVWGPRFAPGLSLALEAGLFGQRSPREVEVGAAAFDGRVSVQGSPAVALALLDAGTREAVAMLLEGRLALQGRSSMSVVGRLNNGVLRLDLPLRPPGTFALRAGAIYRDHEHTLSAALRAIVAFATRLLAPEDTAERLAANLKGEPEAGVRRRLLATLLREFPESSATENAVRTSRSDSDPDVRVRAAVAMGKAGRDVLMDVATEEGAEDATKARAVAALDTSLPLDTVQELLRSALKNRRLLTARACLGILGQLGGAEAGRTLAKVLLVEKNELGEAAARALGTSGDAAAEAPLLRALVEGSTELKRAAAAALGRVGTRDSVARLREAEADAELRAAARQAVAEIHARLAGAAQGQLSLAEGEAGRLSIADDEAGQLSLADEEPGGVRS